MTTTSQRGQQLGNLEVVPLTHPQGCRSYLLGDPDSRQAMAIDPHLDLVGEIGRLVEDGGWTLRYVIDTHTHADHPSGSASLASAHSSTRVAHAAAGHAGVTRHPEDGGALHLGDVAVTVRHAPGHTPDHLVLLTDHALFSGDSLLIGGVARTDFLGGDAGQLFDSVHRIVGPLADQVVLYPGHDYQGRTQSTIGHERATNPWLRIEDRAEFVKALTANPPPRPANMDDLLSLNQQGTEIPKSIAAAKVVERVNNGGVGSVIDIRTPGELQQEHVAGARHVTLEEILARVDEVRAVPAPRLLLCRSGKRAELARQQLEALGVSGLSVVEGGILAFAAANGKTVKARSGISLERQERIAAGILIVIAVALGLLVHPVCHVVALLLGAGQVLAGVTDHSAMARLLKVLPWNRREDPAPAAAPTSGGCAAPPPTVSGGCAAPPPDVNNR